HLRMLLTRTAPHRSFAPSPYTPLFRSPYGLNTRQYNAWVRHAGGLQVLRELFAKYNIVNFPCGYTGTQMGGWFRKEVKSVEDLKGLKFRTAAFAGAVLMKLGEVPRQIAGG